MVFFSASPRLRDGDEPARLRECPVGKILRETPHLYEALAVASGIEAGSYSPIDAPPWLMRVYEISGSERSRLLDDKLRKSKARNQTVSDSEFGKRARAAR